MVTWKGSREGRLLNRSKGAGVVTGHSAGDGAGCWRRSKRRVSDSEGGREGAGGSGGGVDKLARDIRAAQVSHNLFDRGVCILNVGVCVCVNEDFIIIQPRKGLAKKISIKENQRRRHCHALSPIWCVCFF